MYNRADRTTRLAIDFCPHAKSLFGDVARDQVHVVVRRYRLTIAHQRENGPLRTFSRQAPQQESANQAGGSGEKNAAQLNAPPQLEPAPAVQPKQCAPVATRCSA